MEVVSRDGTRIGVSRVGSGRPLVFVDGAFCYRQNGPSAGLARALAPHFTVFTYDRRGRGESTDTGPYSIEREIEDLKAVAAEAGEGVVLAGLSSGAALALQAVASGLRAERLCLYDPPYVSRPLDDEKRRLEQLVAVGDRRGAAKLFLAEIVRVPRFFLAVMPLLMRGTWRNNESVALTLPYDLALLADVSVLQARAAAIAVPTLVAAGAKSSPELREAAERVARALPNTTLRLLPGVGHDVPPAALAQVLIEFAAGAKEAA